MADREFVIKVINEIAGTIAGLGGKKDPAENYLKQYKQAIKQIETKNKEMHTAWKNNTLEKEKLETGFAGRYQQQWNQVLNNIGKVQKSVQAEYNAERKKSFADLEKAKKQQAAQELKSQKEIEAYEKQQDAARIKRAKEIGAARRLALKQSESVYRTSMQKQIQLDKARLQTMNKDEQAYWQKKMNIRGREINLVKNLTAEQRAILKKGYRDQLNDERAKYEKSKELATDLQNTLKSVFQRAVLYTGLYRVIQMVNQAMRDWITTNIELDYAIAKVNTISKVSITQFERLKQMSTDTGRSMVDLSNALYDINSAGITGERGMKVLEVATRAAVGGFVDAKNAADTITDVLNAYKLGTDSAEIVTSKLLKTVELGKLKWEEYQGQLGQVLPAAYELGVSLDDTLGSMATLTLAGIPLNKSITGMRNIMIKFLKPTKGMKDALYQLNTNLGETYGSIQDVIKAKGFINTLKLLGDVTNQTDIETVELFNNIRGLTAELALMNDSGVKATEISAKIAAATDTLNEKYSIMAETLTESKNRMVAMWSVLGTELFTFGDKIRIVYGWLTSLAAGLREIAPLIKGLATGFLILASAAALVGAKFLIMEYVLPVLGIGFKSVTTLSAVLSAKTLILGNSFAVGASKALIFQAALGGITLILAAAVAAYIATNEWIEKNRIEAQRAQEAFDNMNKTFKEAAKSSDILSRTRPFAGMDRKALVKQVEMVNQKLRRRKELLEDISQLEYTIRNIDDKDSSPYKNAVDDLVQLKGELVRIEGVYGENLKAMQALSNEYRYQDIGLSNIQVAALKAMQGLESLSELSLAGMGIEDLKKLDETLRMFYTDALKQSKSGTEEEKKLWEERLANTSNAIYATSQKLAAMEAELQAKLKNEAGIGEADRLKLEQKYRALRLKETLDGRIQLLEEEKKAEKALATKMGASEQAKLDITAEFDRKIEDEKKKHYKEIEKEAKKHNDAIIKNIESTNKLRLKLEKEYQDSKREIAEGITSQEEKWEKDALDIKTKYLDGGVEAAKIAHEKQLDDLELARWADLEIMRNYTDIKLAMDLEYKQKLDELTEAQTEKQIAAWTKQHEFYAWTINSISEMSKTAIQTVLDEEMSGQKKREAIWSATKNLIINSFAEMVAAFIKSKLLQLAVEKSTAVATIATNTVLTASYNKLGQAMALASWGASAIAGAGGWLAAQAMVLGANVGTGVSDAIIQDDKITPFRKDDVVAIGTNMYGTRSGYNTGGIESKLDQVISAINDGTLAMIKKPMIVNVDPINPAKINDLNKQGEKINRRIGG